MDFISVFHKVWKLSITFSEKNGALSTPTFDWTARNLCDLLLQYPSGLTQAVLLTELESKWRLYLRRGENAGKLRQVLISLQVDSRDVLLGQVTAIGSDESRRSALHTRRHSTLLMLYVAGT